MITRRTLLFAGLVAGAMGAAAAVMIGSGIVRPERGIGGPFALTTVDGAPFTDRDLAGKPYVLFFGFTRCPDVCPTTLTNVSGWLAALGGRAERLDVVFVTVDPERDDAATLKSYMSAFDPRIVALTGTPAAVTAMLGTYRAFARKVPLDGGDYTIDHTAAVYLFDGTGAFRSVIGYSEASDTALGKLEALITDAD
jgi:protein SCO1/2